MANTVTEIQEDNEMKDKTIIECYLIQVACFRVSCTKGSLVWTAVGKWLHNITA